MMTRKSAVDLFGIVSLLLVARCASVTSNRLCTLESTEEGPSTVVVYVKESLPVGSTVTHLKVHGSNTEIRLNLIQNSSYVQFDRSSRNITVAESLNGQTRILLKIRCSRIQSGLTLDFQVLILIKDINNNPPKFTRSEYKADVNELSPVGTTIITGILATDADANNNYITYELLPGLHSDYFDIPVPAQGVVTLKKVLDFESVSKLTVTVVAKDNHQTIAGMRDVQLNGTTSLVVNVQDGDDLNPQFTRNTYKLIIPENVAIDTDLTIKPPLEASDGDKSINTAIEYSIVPDDDLQDSEFFAINSRTGVISLQKAPTIRGTRFALLIKASQIDKPERYGTALLHVIVQGANDNKPTFLQRQYVLDVPESMPAGSAVVTVAAVDNDEGAILEYRLEQPNSFFQIDTKTGVITTLQPLDYEVTKQIRLVAVVSDGTREDTSDVIINVQNVNDNNPVFAEKIYMFDMKERIKGSVVGSVKATDIDTASRLTYLVTDDTNLFSISERGEIRISEDSDSTVVDSVYKLMVTAVDEGSPPRQSSVFVVVTFASKPPVTGEVRTQSEPDYVIIIVLSVLAGLLLFMIVAMVIYIAKRGSSLI